MQIGRRRLPVARSGSPTKLRENSLTASGSRIDNRDADDLRRLNQPWQARSFAYYDMLGEIKYAAQFYARMLGPLELFAAERNEEGELVPTDNEDAKAALERIQDPGGGRTVMLSQYGRLMFLVGEALLFVTEDEDTGEEQWEMLSTNELRPQSGELYIRYAAPSLSATEYRAVPTDDWTPIDDQKHGTAYRLWKRHPNYSMWPDATMQGVLDLCEELVLLTQAVRSRARSRLAGAGILVIDSAITPPPLEPGKDDDPLQDPLLADIAEAIMTPIADEGSAAAVVPYMLRVSPGDTKKVSDMIYHLTTNDPTQLYPETGLRRECIERIAIGLDMPPEILLGITDANHWSGWLIDEQTWKHHGQPVAQQLVDDLSSSYFRPYLRSLRVPDFQKYTIAYDASSIINHPDRSKDAKDLYDRVVISKAALRDAAGFDEDDAPSEDERAEMIGIKVRDGGLAWDGTPTIRGGQIETAPGVVSDSTTDTPVSGPATGADVEKGPPAAPPTEEQPPGVAALFNGNGNGRAAMIASQLVGASQLALLRAREAAGNKIRSKAKKDPDTFALLTGVRPGAIASTLGAAKVRELGCGSETELVSGTLPLIEDALRLYHIGGDEGIAGQIAAQIEQHVARTLYDVHPAALPPTFDTFVLGLLSPLLR